MTMPEPSPGGGQIVPAAADVETRYGIEREKMHLGVLGRFFGAPAQAPMNIAGFTVCILTVACVALPFLPITLAPLDYLKIIIPVITLGLGYLLGKKI
jgi:hypothetical protein